MATLASVILRDITANRPAAGTAGRLFYDTTLSKMQRDNGSSWDDVAETAATFRGCKAKIGGTTTMTTAVTEYAVAFSAADEYDTDAFHDPASNNSRQTVPAALTGRYFSAEAWIYIPITAGASNYLDLKFRKNGAAGAVLAQQRVGISGDGNPMTHLYLQPTVLVTSDYIELYAMSNVSGRTVDGTIGSFAIWAVGA